MKEKIIKSKTLLRLECDEMDCVYNWNGECHRGQKLTVSIENGHCIDKEVENDDSDMQE